MPDELHVVSFNLGLLRWKVGPLKLFESPPHVHDRFVHIPAAIAQCGADIILLQEIYEQKHVDAVLAAAKQAGYAHYARGDPRTRPWIQFHNGLLCLSKLPIDGFECLKHAQCSSLEKTPVLANSCLAFSVTSVACIHLLFIPSCAASTAREIRTLAWRSFAACVSVI